MQTKFLEIHHKGVNLRSIVDTLVGSKISHINEKNDGTANLFRVCCAVFQLLIFAVPLGDTLGAFDASLDIGEYEHDVIQLVG